MTDLSIYNKPTEQEVHSYVIGKNTLLSSKHTRVHADVTPLNTCSGNMASSKGFLGDSFKI